MKKLLKLIQQGDTLELRKRFVLGFSFCVLAYFFTLIYLGAKL